MPQRIFAFVLRRLIGDSDLPHSDRIITVANVITSAGIAGVFFYIWLLLARGVTDPALIPTILGIGLTDFIDGSLAALLNQRSKLGKALDPIRDRMFAAALFLHYLLMGQGEYSIWISLGVAAFAESVILSLYVAGFASVHLFGKARALAYVICGLFGVTLVTVYDFGASAPKIALVASIGMALASVGAMIAYIYRAVVYGK